MKRLSIAVAILLIFAHLSLEFGEILERIFPDVGNTTINPFLDPDYKFPIAGGIALKWWVKYVCDDLLLIVTFFVLAIVARKYSWRLFRIAVIFFIYHLIDHILLWWNYRSSHWMYWLLVITIVVSIASMFVKEKESGKMISME